MPNLRNATSLLVLPVLVAVVATVLAPAPAEAKTRSVRAVGIKNGMLVFKLRGVASASKVGGARLRVGRFQRRLSPRRVKRGVRRGVLKVKAPRKVRRRLKRRLARGPARTGGGQGGGGSTVVQQGARQAQLIITTHEEIRLPSRTCSLPANARYVAPSGSDSNPGTAGQPWRTLAKAESSATPGTTVVLRGGSYGARGTITYLEKNGTASAPISLVGHPGENAKIEGHLAVDGDHRRLCGLLLDGATGPVADPSADNPEREQVKLWISGDDVELANSEVSGSRWHAGVYVEGAVGARVVGNYIHDNGRFDDPAHANLDHGIYWSSGSGLVEQNRIEHNVAHAVTLYPRARGVTVRANKMTGHGRAAVLIAEDAADNEVIGNEIFGNRRGIQGYDVRGSGNAARQNRLWNNSDGNFADVDGISLSDNS
jgi:hypothetical protein